MRTKKCVEEHKLKLNKEKNLKMKKLLNFPGFIVLTNVILDN
jgi:hypothetical protein